MRAGPRSYRKRFRLWRLQSSRLPRWLYGWTGRDITLAVLSRSAIGDTEVVADHVRPLTYFEPALQTRLMREIAARLRPGRYLVVGSHEVLPVDIAGFEEMSACPSVFRWLGTG